MTLFLTVFWASLGLSFGFSWENRYNGTGNAIDEARAITLDSDGNIFVTGKSANGNTGSAALDIVTQKISPDGQTLWLARWDSPSHNREEAWAIAADSQGSVYVGGFTYSPVTQNDFVLLKYESSGNLAWERIYNGIGNSDDGITGLVIDPSGNVIVSGTSWGITNPTIGTLTDIETIKYDSNGNEIWQRRHDAVTDLGLHQNSYYLEDYAAGLAVDSGGNVYILGTSTLPHFNGQNHDEDIVLIKYAPNGTKLLSKYLNGALDQFDYAHDLAVDPLRNIYILGRTQSSSVSNTSDFWTLRLSENAEIEWQNTYVGVEPDLLNTPQKIALAPNGDVVITGTSWSSTHPTDTQIIRYENQTGNLQWNKAFSNTLHTVDIPQALRLDPSGNAMIAGYTWTEQSYNYFILKYNEAGTLTWFESYNGSGNSLDQAHAIALAQDGSLFITGHSGYDYLTVKYPSVITQTDPNQTEISTSFSLSQNYPNPFNPSTHISYHLPSAGLVKLEIFDSTGKLIHTLVNGQQSAGDHESVFRGDLLPSGIYFYRLQSGSFVETKRMTLIK